MLKALQGMLYAQLGGVICMIFPIISHSVTKQGAIVVLSLAIALIMFGVAKLIQSEKELKKLERNS